jgi:hypothetical protein
LDELEPELVPVLLAVKELEQLLGFSKLDIEFGVGATGDVYIFQVRPITVDHSDYEVAEQSLYQEMDSCAHQFRRLQTRPSFLVGERTFFGNMPDWNPAEIIGTRPRPLALSLYRWLITDNVWARQRFEFGYRDVCSQPLLVTFCGQPYVDIRASLNSFIPAALSEDCAERLVDAYIQILHDNTQLHDKLEFDVAFTVWTPSFEEEARKRLLPYGITTADIDDLGSALRHITKCACGRLWQDVASVETLVARRSHLEQAPLHPLDKALALLEDCRRFGTLAFAHAARAGFVATSFLRSFMALGVLSDAERQDFLRSIRTVAGEFELDRRAMAMGDMEKAAFIERYGHLRLGTYDATIEAYWEATERYLFAKTDTAVRGGKVKPRFLSSDSFRNAVETQIHRLDPDLTFDKFFGYLSAAIQQREYVKFEFTRNLSRALDELVKLGRELGLSREEVTFLNINDYEQLKLGVLRSADLFDLIRQRKQNFVLTQMMEFPPLICEEADFFGFELQPSQPNFVTALLAEGPVVVWRGEEYGELRGSIVLIPQADPGYDWLLGYGIAGLITRYGGANSHMAIRAAEMGLAAAIGVGDKLFEQLSRARRILLDCANQVIRPI